MDALFEATFSPLAATGKPFSKCGVCLRYMRFIPLKPQRLYCAQCEEAYALPQNGTIKLYKELKCPLDGFELVLFSLGNSEQAQGKTFPLCPYCFSNPPSFKNVIDDDGVAKNENKKNKKTLHTNNQEFEIENSDGSKNDNKKAVEKETDDEDLMVVNNMGCNLCKHPTCKQSSVQNYVTKCPNILNDNLNCGGDLVLDVTSKPNWKLCCNVCNLLIRFKADIHNITPQPLNSIQNNSNNVNNSNDNDAYCLQCNNTTRILTIEFNKLKTPLPNNETVYRGCICCDSFLNNLTENLTGRSINLTVLRQIRHKRGANGRGRGRGRGGRVRGDVKMSFSGF
jgi:DNA topoisomerase-3